MTRHDLANLINARRVMHGADKLPIDRILRACRLAFGPEPKPWLDRPPYASSTRPIGPRVKPGPKQYAPRYACPGRTIRDVHYVCDAVLVQRTGGRSRCRACSLAMDNELKRIRLQKARDAARAEQEGAKQRRTERICIGHELDEGSHKCTRVIGPQYVRQKRCNRCQLEQALWTARMRHRKLQNDPRKSVNRDARMMVRRDATDVPNRPQHPCEVCAGMPHAREPGRVDHAGRPVLGEDGLCRGCGEAYAPLPPVRRCEVLRSNAGGEMTRNYSR